MPLNDAGIDGFHSSYQEKGGSVSQWYLVLLSVNRDRLVLPGYPGGSLVFLRGYYIIMAQRDEAGNLINCKPQSQRFLEEADVLAAFQSMLPNGI